MGVMKDEVKYSNVRRGISYEGDELTAGTDGKEAITKVTSPKEIAFVMQTQYDQGLRGKEDDREG